jgi:hypothetical protein
VALERCNLKVCVPGNFVARIKAAALTKEIDGGDGEDGDGKSGGIGEGGGDTGGESIGGGSIAKGGSGSGGGVAGVGSSKSAVGSRVR